MMRRVELPIWKLLLIFVGTPEVFLGPAFLVELAEADGGRDAAVVRRRGRVLFVLVIGADGDYHMIKVLAEHLKSFVDHLLLGFGHAGRVKVNGGSGKRKRMKAER